jgi:hypothetical protein
MSGRLRPARRPGNILRGIALIASGRRDGLDQFGDQPQDFLASLAPLIAFPLVGGLLMLVGGQPRAAASGFITALVALLTPPVLSYEPARWWRRQDHWLRYATALNWCQWIVPVLAIILLTVVFPVAQSVASTRTAGTVVIGLLVAYGLWLHWFIARHGLAISGLRAALLVVLINLATVVLVFLPQFVSTGRLASLVR